MFEVSRSVHGMPCVEVRRATPEQRNRILRGVHANRMDDPVYHLRTLAGAFLQGDDGEWMLVEFWQPDYAPFVAWLNGEEAA